MKNVLLAIAILISLSAYSQKRYITIDSTKIWINTIGLENRKEGQPLIVFESGSGTPMDNWDKVLDGVSKMAPLMTYDRPGVGNSGPEKDSVTIKGFSDRLLKILNSLNAAPPYVLVVILWVEPWSEVLSYIIPKWLQD